MTRLISWNVNGIRSCASKGFLPWLAGCGADIVGLQETRADEHQLEPAVRAPQGFHAVWSPCLAKKGYSGVALLSKVPPLAVERSIGVPEFDQEGRVILAEFREFIVANVYFPNGAGKNGDNTRVPFKLAFYEQLYKTVGTWERDRGKPALVMGDMNTAHQEIDIARPAENQKTSGFLPEEREHLGKMLALGYVDTFRALHPDTVQYSWWSMRQRARDRNIGWRLDYVFASQSIFPKVRSAFILHDCMGSDHCPVGLDLDAMP